MLKTSDLKDIIHTPGFLQKDKLFLILAVDVACPKKVLEIKKIATAVGLRDASKWNITAVLRRFKKYVINTPGGWELNSHGKEFVSKNLIKNSPPHLKSSTFAGIDFNTLITSDKDLAKVLNLRLNEINKTITVEAYLSAMIMLGTLLEGLLVFLLYKNIKQSMTAQIAPKDSKTGQTKNINQWSFSDMINVSHELGWIKDTKQFGHALREYRNCIHPFEQKRTKNFPSRDTVNICATVVEAAINEMRAYL